MSIVSPWLHLGYIIPHLYTDMDAYQFYRVAPDGMMLVSTGLNLKEYSLAAVESELPALWRACDLLKKKNVDRIALSGVPVASVLGRKKMREILTEAQQRSGLPCRSRGRSLDQNKVANAAADHELALELGAQALQDAPQAQALLLPGGLWYAIHAVPLLEAQFGKPVLLNILSTTWAALNAAPNPLQQRPDPRWGKVLAGI